MVTEGWTRSWPILLIVLWVVMPLAIAVVATATVKPLLVARFLLVVVPGLALLAAVGIVELADRGPRLAARLALAGLLAASAVGVVDTWNRPTFEDWRGAVDHIVDGSETGDVVVPVPGRASHPLRYYLERADAEDVTIVAPDDARDDRRRRGLDRQPGRAGGVERRPGARRPRPRGPRADRRVAVHQRARAALRTTVIRSPAGLAFALRVRAHRHRPDPVSLRLRRLRHHAVARSPFYARHHAGLERAPLDRLPPVAKAQLLESFDEVVADRAVHRADLEAHLRAAEPGTPWRDGVHVAVTSGSAGPPALLAYAPSEWAALVANAVESRTVGDGPGTGTLRSARIGSPLGWHLSAQLGNPSGPADPALRLSAAAPLDDLVRALAARDPERLTAYPSVLGRLADEALARRLTITPRQVRAGGELLSDGVRDRVRAAWGVEVVDQYAIGEAGFLAVECPARDGLHVLDRHVVLEVVDADDGLVPIGVEGERVLLTVLSSRLVPLIRYVIEDRVTLLPGVCACGRHGPRLRVAGHVRDVLTFPGPGGPVAVHPVVFTRVLDALRVGDWRVTRRAGDIRVAIAGPGADLDDEALAAALRASLAEVLDDPPPVVVDRVTAIDPVPGGKASRVVNELA